ncbi:hypothetical protein WKH56_20140 [Priestia sp. SB1]|uniref:hypothetical protein n=1 Tax=Priestia sp. SB1 TaxID=3132359 RepID=UPI00317CA779
MKSNVLDVFYENWDGTMVLSNVDLYTNEADFLRYAKQYLAETRDFDLEVTEPVEFMKIVVNEEGNWCSKEIAESEEFKGKEVWAYKTDIKEEE